MIAKCHKKKSIDLKPDLQVAIRAASAIALASCQLVAWHAKQCPDPSIGTIIGRCLDGDTINYDASLGDLLVYLTNL